MVNSEITVNKGVSQGSCLSAILFNLYTSELHAINDHQSTLLQYADDFFLITFDKDFMTARNVLEHKVNVFREMCKSINLTFNPLKSSVMHFNNKKKLLNIMCNNVAINDVDQVIYLGRTISINNSSIGHVKHIIAKANKTNMLLNMLSGCRFGIHPSKALNLFKAFVRPKYDYAFVFLR